MLLTFDNNLIKRMTQNGYGNNVLNFMDFKKNNNIVWFRFFIWIFKYNKIIAKIFFSKVCLLGMHLN